ncbi:hypothetical protein AMECASPLE_030113 [Ameca splendens]|uniref:Uncharacterized protein n=1 Tax=Ameca splendens TaxID=208324 RepID=A0ABV0Y5S4_9TELE
MLNTHTLARRSPARKPIPKSTNGGELTEPKPTEKLRPVHPGQSTRPNHADPSDPPPPDRIGAGNKTGNQNLNWNQPDPNDAYTHLKPTTHLHPRRIPTPTSKFMQQ